MSTQVTRFVFHRRYISGIISITLAILFLFLALRGIDWEEVLHTLANVQVLYLCFGLGFFSISLFLRSLRWQTLLSARKHVPLPVMFWATAVGYLGNSFLPARAGEAIRSVAVGNNSGISKSFIFATAITERILDACFLVVGGMLLLPQIDQLPGELKSFLWMISPVILLAVVMIAFAPKVLGFFVRVWRGSFLSRINLPENWMAKVSAFAEQYAEGAAAFVHPRRALLFFILTFVIWVLDGCGAVIMAFSLGLAIRLEQAILFLFALGLSSALPSTPGYLGLYQITAVTILPSFGFTRSQALTYIFVVQFTNMVGVLVWGVWGLLRLGVKLNPDRTNRPDK
jgi:glycosyltransferase 2 family protein